MMNKYCLLILTGLISTLILIFLTKKISLRNNLMIPNQIPLIGGIAMGFGFVLSCLLFLPLFGKNSKEIIGLIAASLLMLAFGIIDDFRELSVSAKFLIQIIATSFLILFGIRTNIIYIGNLPNIIITFIWVIGVSNAFNHLDVIDGLAAATAIIVSCVFFGISFLNGDAQTAILALALVGPLISFLIYNLPPARIYMGNSGSHFLGFVLAAISLIISYSSLDRKIALISPLIILGLPIFDTSFLILARIRRKRIPFKKSDDHLALRFLALGYSKKKSLLTMLAWCLFFSISGAIVSKVSNFFGVIIVTFVVLASLVFAKKMIQTRPNA